MKRMKESGMKMQQKLFVVEFLSLFHQHFPRFFRILTAVKMSTVVFWLVTPRDLEGVTNVPPQSMYKHYNRHRWLFYPSSNYQSQ
jgi:hypothetical protein